MRNLLLIQLGLVLLGVTYFSATSINDAVSFGAGGFLMMANVFLLGFLWDRILRKKLVALSVSIIVGKYALLGFILFKLFATPGIEALPFSLGIATFGIASGVYALFASVAAPEVKGSP